MKRYTREDAKKDFEELWEPLLYANGALDLRKIEAEMGDLIFVHEQIARVYCHITGGLLSKAMYYADVVIDQYNDQIQKAYDEGYADAVEEN